MVKGLGTEGELFGGRVDTVCDPKIDGVAINLRYEKGQLVPAVTRGDGEKGDDVTVQVRVHPRDSVHSE